MKALLANHNTDYKSSSGRSQLGIFSVLFCEVDLCDVVVMPVSQRGMRMFSQANGKALHCDTSFLAESPTPKSLCRSLGVITDSILAQPKQR